MSFPALIPSAREYVDGDYPSTAHQTLRGSEVRVRHSNQPIGAILSLSYLGRTTDDLETIIAHYGAARGSFYSFVLSPEALSIIDDYEEITPPGHRWIYESFPAVVDVPIDGDTPSNLHDITITLKSVPPEPVVALGARLRVNISVEGGIAYDADAYWSSWGEQHHVWYSESYTPWWAT